MKKLLTLMLIAIVAMMTSCNEDPFVPDPIEPIDTTAWYPDSAIIIMHFNRPPAEYGLTIAGSGYAVQNPAILDDLYHEPILFTGESNGPDTTATLVIPKDQMMLYFNVPINIILQGAATSPSVRAWKASNTLYNEKIVQPVTEYDIILDWTW